MTLTWLPNALTLTRIALAFAVAWLILTLPAAKPASPQMAQAAILSQSGRAG
ncbi:MAG: hypothetical protein AAGL97_00800 [Pseudomonadota bacterium]